MSPKFDRERWGRFFAREMSAQRRPREILQRVFQAPIRNISRERAVHFLCFYLTCGELEDQEQQQQQQDQQDQGQGGEVATETPSDVPAAAIQRSQCSDGGDCASYPRPVVDEASNILYNLERDGGFRLHSDPGTAWLAAGARTEGTCRAVYDGRGGRTAVDFARIGRFRINAFYKPLPALAFLAGVRVYAEAQLRGMGFERRRGELGLIFWARHGRDEAECARREQVAGAGAVPSMGASRFALPPLFVLHGLGFGVVPYVRFVRALLDERRTIVLPEFPNISLGWADNRCETPPTSQQYAEALNAMLHSLRDAHGQAHTRCDAIGHSYGTIVLNYWNSHFPSSLRRRVLIDCLSFCTSFHRWVTFAYEYCLKGWPELIAANSRLGWIKCFAMWFTKGDLAVQQVGKRHTYFMEMVAPEGTINEDCMVVLGGQDEAVPAYDIAEYVRARGLGCTVCLDDEWRHGGILFQPDPHGIWQQIADWVCLTANDQRPFSGMRRVRSDPSLRGHIFGTTISAPLVSPRPVMVRQQ